MVAQFSTGILAHFSISIYNKYLCKRCGDLVGQEYGWHFLPTRAALNVVYLF